MSVTISAPSQIQSWEIWDLSFDRELFQEVSITPGKSVDGWFLCDSIKRIFEYLNTFAVTFHELRRFGVEAQFRIMPNGAQAPFMLLRWTTSHKEPTCTVKMLGIMTKEFWPKQGELTDGQPMEGMINGIQFIHTFLGISKDFVEKFDQAASNNFTKKT